MEKPCSVAVCFALLSGLTAQARAPFTGTLRDLDGKPLGNAKVACAWQPGLAGVGPPDHRETKTDAEGRFVIDLVVGRAYVVWAIGPAGADGTRAVVLPDAQAAGGKQMDLHAGMLSVPVTLQVTGTSPWIADGPLAVRIGIHGGIALGPDIAIPGDGRIVLPPLPTDQIRVALVDARGVLLGMHLVDARANTEVAFAEPREFDVLVESDAGAPLAGARLLSQTHDALPPANARAAESFTRRDCHVVAATDAAGRAHCRIASTSRVLFLFAEREGHAGAVSGWFDEVRFENGKWADGDPERPLHFVLAKQEPTAVRVVGAMPREVIEVHFAGFASVRMKNGGSAMPLTFSTVIGENGLYSCAGPTASDGVFAQVGVRRDQPVPHLTVASVRGDEGLLPDIDLRSLRTFDVQLADPNGGHVPCGHLSILSITKRGQVDTLGMIVTDSEGRAEVRIPPEDLLIYASTTTHVGVVLLAGKAPSGQARITMRPLATMQIRVVDESRAPVMGARLEVAEISGGAPEPTAGQAPEQHALACLDAALARRQPPSHDRTNRRGEIILRCPEQQAQVKIRAWLGNRKSDAIERAANSEPCEVVLR